MAFNSSNGRRPNNLIPSTMDSIIETARYPSAESGSQSPLPPSWTQHHHPNNDVYFYNRELRLITPNDIRVAQIHTYVMDAREDHLECLDGDDNSHILPADYETVISEVTETAATINMYSRSARTAYTWSEDTGLVLNLPELFWSHIAEYPSHHRNLPSNIEEDFVLSLQNARASIAAGDIFPFTETQIERIIEYYRQLVGFRSRGRNITPRLAWLVGVVMPLEARVGRAVDNRNLEAVINGHHF